MNYKLNKDIFVAAWAKSAKMNYKLNKDIFVAAWAKKRPKFCKKSPCIANTTSYN
jgi:hypothetical protein